MNNNVFIKVFILALGIALSAPHAARASGSIPNHSFEDFDDTTWQCDDQCTAGNAFAYYVSTTDKDKQPPDGDRYLYIFHEAGLYQNVTVPSNIDSLTFGYYNTEDDTGDAVYDGVFTITLTDVATGEMYTQETYSDQSDNWKDGSLAVPAAAQGQTVELHVSNVSGFNRIDNFVFAASTDTFATVQVRVLNAQAKPVQRATISIKHNGENISLLNLKTNKTVQAVTTNKKGRTPSFIILQELAEGESVKLCVKKNKVKDCVAVTPAAGVETAYDFSL